MKIPRYPRGETLGTTEPFPVIDITLTKLYVDPRSCLGKCVVEHQRVHQERIEDGDYLARTSQEREVPAWKATVSCFQKLVNMGEEELLTFVGTERVPTPMP